MGLSICKFFPANTFGGSKGISSLGGPFTNMRFMPTGGINTGNLQEYLAHPKVVACGGSWLVKPALIEGGEFKKITQLAEEALELAGQSRGSSSRSSSTV